MKRVVGNQSARAPLFLALMILTMSVTACGPTLGFPGGRLTGILAPEPVSNWSFRDETEIVQLETRLSRPYSTNIWGVSSGAAFYISSESWRSLLGLADAHWVALISRTIPGFDCAWVRRSTSARPYAYATAPNSRPS